jgi:hypothetical protein
MIGDCLVLAVSVVPPGAEGLGTFWEFFTANHPAKFQRIGTVYDFLLPHRSNSLFLSFKEASQEDLIQMDHSVDLTVHSVTGSIGWHFSIYIDNSNNFGGTEIRKLRWRDDESSRMNPGETWHEIFPVPDPATYVLDFSDWDDDPQVEVQLIIDNILRLSAHGRTDNLETWDKEPYGPGVRKTDDREIGIDLN